MLINLTESIYKVFLLCIILLTTGCETFTFTEEEVPAPAEQAVPAEVTEKPVVDDEPDAGTVTETVEAIAPDCPPAEKEPLLPVYSDSVALDKTLIGEVEYIHLIKPAMRLAARIDTGATTSSLGVVEQQTYERDGQKWVRFFVAQPGTEQLIELRQPIVRMATVKGAASMKDRRIVVALDVRLGDVVEKTEFNLADRRHFQYPVLIGRNLLRGEFVVDVGQQYLLSSGGEQE